MLKYNEGIYQGKIDQLTEYISMLNGHIEKLTTYKDQLKMFWDDVDGMNLSKALQAALTSTNNQLFYLQKQLSFYKKMVAEYSSASATCSKNRECLSGHVVHWRYSCGGGDVSIHAVSGKRCPVCSVKWILCRRSCGKSACCRNCLRTGWRCAFQTEAPGCAAGKADQKAHCIS